MQLRRLLQANDMGYAMPVGNRQEQYIASLKNANGLGPGQTSQQAQAQQPAAPGLYGKGERLGRL
jgi:hypothetical protein